MAEAACECERARVIIIHSCGGTCILDITSYMYIQPHTGTHTHSDYIIYYLGLRQVGGSGLVMVMPLWYACRPLSRPLLRTFTALPALPALPTLLALPALPSSTRAFRLCYCTLYLLAALSTKQTSWRPCCHAASHIIHIACMHGTEENNAFNG